MTEPSGVAGGFVAFTAASAVAATARGLFSQEIVRPRWRTAASATVTIGLALGWATTAAAGGVLIRTAGFPTLFTLCAVLAAACAAAALIRHALLWGRTARLNPHLGVPHPA